MIELDSVKLKPKNQLVLKIAPSQKGIPQTPFHELVSFFPMLNQKTGRPNYYSFSKESEYKDLAGKEVFEVIDHAKSVFASEGTVSKREGVQMHSFRAEDAFKNPISCVIEFKKQENSKYFLSISVFAATKDAQDGMFFGDVAITSLQKAQNNPKAKIFKKTLSLSHSSKGANEPLNYAIEYP